MKYKRGFVLLTVLSLSFVLLAIVSVLCKDAFFQMNKSVVFNSKNEAQMIAEAGVNKAIFFLEKKNGAPSPGEWSGELSDKKVNNGTFDVRLWNNLTSSTSKNVSEINDGSVKKVPAKSMIIESVGKTVNGYKKTVTTIVSYQLIPQMIDSEDNISIKGNGDMSINLDSVSGFKPKIHSDAISKSSWYSYAGLSGIFGVDSSIRLDNQVKVTAPKGSVFSTKSSFIDTDSTNKIASLNNPPSQLLTNQPGRNYNISDFIKNKIEKPGSDVEVFNLDEINKDPDKLKECRDKFKKADSLVAKLFGVDINDYVKFDSSGNFISDVDKLTHVTFTGAYRGDDGGKLWASMEIDYTTIDSDGNEVSNEGTVWLAVAGPDIADPMLPSGFEWDNNKTLKINSGSKFLSEENDSCAGALTLENLSLNIESNVEMYIGKKLTIKDSDVICDDDVDIFSSDDIVLDNSTCRIGNPFNLEETNKVSIITNGDFIALLKGNPADNKTGKYISRADEDGSKNYIKGSIYAKNDVIINGNDCAFDIEGVLISNGMFMMNNYRITDSSWGEYAPFLSSFTYNPYLAGQFLQDSLNSVDLQLEPLIWEVR